MRNNTLAIGLKTNIAKILEFNIKEFTKNIADAADIDTDDEVLEDLESDLWDCQIFKNSTSFALDVSHLIQEYNIDETLLTNTNGTPMLKLNTFIYQENKNVH